nr:M48 family metalloprotease [Nocardioides sp. zg-DK7169]
MLFVALAAWLVPWDPVPGGDLEPVDPAAYFGAEHLARAETFTTWSRVWSWSSLAVSLLVACWFGFTRRGRGIVAKVQRGPWWLQVVAAVAFLDVVGRLVTLPFGIRQRQHLREYGLSVQSWGGYAADLVKGEVLDVVVTSLALVAVMACARRWRRAWPVIAAGVAATLVMLGSFVYPLVVEPLFSSFTPLEEGPLRAGVLALAEEEGVEVDEVLVSDASRRTTTLNAYVSGFGGTRRVVLYDTLVEELPREQALTVVAHELAHARHDDVLVGSVLGATGAAFGVGLLGLVLGGRRRATRLGDPASVPVVLALFALASFLSSPVQNTISRQVELRADVDSLRATEDPETFVDMQVQLMTRSLADPTPWAPSQLWFGSHPTGWTRIALAERMGGAGD